MKKQLLVSLCLLLIVLFTGNGRAQGVLKGRVIDAQNLSLPGANVLVQGTTFGTVTDQKGDFSIPNLPAGNVEIKVSYLGYGELIKAAQIQTGQTTTLDFKMDESVLLASEFVVFGDRLKGQAKALNQQKNNANITNIVSSDQIGRFPDANIGDALKRIPGITMQNDQG